LNNEVHRFIRYVTPSYLSLSVGTHGWRWL
jgi:hypothetical protein